MKLLDRFRAQPRQKHSEPAVRLSFVHELPLSERDLLAEISREDADPRVRRAAAAKLMDPAALAAIAAGDSEFREPALAAVDRVSDRHDLDQIASRAKNKSAAKRARAILREADERETREREALAAAAVVEPAAPVD